MKTIFKIITLVFLVLLAVSIAAHAQNTCPSGWDAITRTRGTSFTGVSEVMCANRSTGELRAPGSLTVDGTVTVGTTVLLKCGGVDDTALVQNALNNRGHIMLSPGSICVVTANPIIYSDTWLDLNKGTLSFPTTTGTILKNASYVSTPTTVTDGEMTAGSATLTCASCAFDASWVNKSAYVVGANAPDQEAATLFATIAAVSDANTATLSQTAYQTVSGATVNFYTRDQNIRISDGRIQGNMSTRFARNTNRNNFFHRVDNLTLENVTLATYTGEWGFFVADVTRFRADNIYCDDTVADCIDLIGPASDVSLRHIHGRTNDDLIALAGHASNADAIGNSVYGPITRVLLEDMSGTGLAHTLRIESYTPTATMTDITVRNLTQLKSGGIAILDTPTGLEGYFDRILIDGVYADSDFFYAPVEAQASHGGGITIRNVYYQSSAALGSGKLGAVRVAGTWTSVLLDNITMTQTAGTSFHGILLDDDATIGNFTANNITLNAGGATSSGQLFSVKAVQVGNFSGNNWRLNHTSAAGAMSMLTTFSTLTSPITRFSARGLQISTASATAASVFNLASPGAVGDLRIQDAQWVSGNALDVFFTLAATAAAGNIDIRSVSQSGGANLATLLGAITGSVSVNPGILYVTSGNTDTLNCPNNTTSDFATTYTIPAKLIRAGKLLRITVGYSLTTSAGAPTINFKLQLGGVAVFTSSTLPTTSAITGRSSAVSFVVQGTAAPGASVAVYTNPLNNWFGANAVMTPMGGNTVSQPVNLNTAAGLAIVPGLFCSANTAGNSMTIQQLIVEALN